MMVQCSADDLTGEVSGGLAGVPRCFCQGVDTREVGEGFPGGTVVKNLPANAEDTGLSPGPGRSHMPQSN